MSTRLGQGIFAAGFLGLLVCATGFAQTAGQPHAGISGQPDSSAAPQQSPSAGDPQQANPSPTAELDAIQPASASWHYTLAPLLWLASIDGDGGDGSSPPTNIGEDWSPFGSINGGFMLAFEARAPDERFSWIADGLYLSLADDQGAVRTDTDALMLEFGGGLALDAAGNWEAIAGLRYVDLEFGTQVSSVSTSARQTWIDPWIGLRGEVALGGRWGLGMRADVGGFGVGTQLTWQAYAAIGAQLGKSVRFDIGYRAMGLDFDDDELEYDAIIYGPQIALAFLF